MGLKGKQGTSTGSVEYSPAKLRKIAKRRASEERRWASLAGPVTVTTVEKPAEDQVPDDDSANL